MGSASAINVAFVALLSLLLAKTLSVEEFGIVRTVTAYSIILTMIGSFTIQDALAFYIVKSKDGDINSLFFHATIMTALFSSLTAICAMAIFYSFDLWQGDLKICLIVISALLPILSLTILYNNSLQALGSHRVFAALTIISALVPLIIIIPLSYALSLKGWLTGRFISAAVLLFAAYYFVRENVSICKIGKDKIFKLWSFSRVQFISGIFSLILMSMDVVYLEYVTHNLPMIANYGLAQLFAKSPLFIASTISRSYFKDIASVGAASTKKVTEFLMLTTLVSSVVALAAYSAFPIFIKAIYGPEYEAANSLLKAMSIGIIFSFLWNAISTITVAQGKPSMAVKVSSIGAVTGVALLYFLTPRYEALGVAWAMNIAYATGVITGLYLIITSDFDSNTREVYEKS